MQKIYFNRYIVIIFIFLFTTGSCKKDTGKMIPGGASSLMLVDGTVGSTTLYTNFNGTNPTIGTSYSDMTNIFYGTFFYVNNYSGAQKLGLFQDPDTLATSKPVFNLVLNLPLNTVHTLFLAGTLQTPDTLFTTDYPPYHAEGDSTMGIRFVNISRNGGPVSVNLAGKPNGSELTTLPYKGVTVFKNYPAGLAAKDYTFEFRNQITGELLGSCILETSRRYKNFTLTLLSEPGGYPLNRCLVVRN